MRYLDRILNEEYCSDEVLKYIKSRGFILNKEKSDNQVTYYVRHPKDKYEDKYDVIEIHHMSNEDRVILREIHTHTVERKESILDMLKLHLEG